MELKINKQPLLKTFEDIQMLLIIGAVQINEYTQLLWGKVMLRCELERLSERCAGVQELEPAIRPSYSRSGL